MHAKQSNTMSGKVPISQLKVAFDNMDETCLSKQLDVQKRMLSQLNQEKDKLDREIERVLISIEYIKVLSAPTKGRL